MQVIDLGAWTPYLEQELRAPYFAALLQRVGAARAAGTVYPPEERTFFALTATPPERVRAVILGQDPYHEPGQAMGLAFSVPQGERLPPSLRNIFTELHTDLGLPQRLVLCAPHPSPLSSYRGFFGSRPFSQINAFLQENGEQPVDWRLP